MRGRCDVRQGLGVAVNKVQVRTTLGGAICGRAGPALAHALLRVARCSSPLLVWLLLITEGRM